MKELVYHRFLLPIVERLPAKTAVLDGDYSATYEQHLERVLRLEATAPVQARRSVRLAACTFAAAAVATPLLVGAVAIAELSTTC